MKNNIKQFKVDFIKRIKGVKRVVITSHPTPDEDSMACVLTMRALILKYSPDARVRVVYAEETGVRWLGLLGFECVEGCMDMDVVLRGADTLIIVDANNYPRVGISDEAWDGFEGQTICVDHHEKNESIFDLSYIDHTATSVVEILYTIFYVDEQIIPREIADLLLLGILGDTGLLSLISQSSVDVLKVVHRLVSESGADIADLQSRHFRHPLKSLEVLRDGFAHIEVLNNTAGGTCLALYISNSIYESTGLSSAEINHAKDYLITKHSGMFEGVTWGFIVYPHVDGTPNVSFRSRHEGVDVRAMIDKLGLQGGGHAWASGAEFGDGPKTSEEAYSELIRRLKEKNIITS